MGMSFQLTSLRRVRYLIESTFGVSGSGQPAYTDIPVLSADLTLDTTMLPVAILQQRKDGLELAEPGVTLPKLVIKSQLYGAPAALSGSASPPTSHLSNILGCVLGGQYVNSGSGVVSGNSASFTVETGAGSRFKVGQPVALVDSGTGKLRARLISAISGDNLTFANAFPSTPVSGTIVYNGYHTFLREDASGSLQFQVQGADSADQWAATGLQGSIGFENALGALPTVTLTLNGANWISQSLGSLSKVDYSGNFPTPPPVTKDSELLFYRRDSVTTTYTGSNVPVAGVTITPDIKYAPVQSPGDVNNITRWVRNTSTVKVDVTPYMQDTRQYFDARAGKNEFALQLTMGSAAGRTVVITIPRAQVIATERADNGGIVGNKVTIQALKNNITDANASAGFEDLAQSLLVISQF